MPIQLELRVTSGTPIYRGHDHYWSVLRDLGKDGREFTLREVALRCNDRQDKCIKDYMRRLKAADILQSVRTEPNETGTTRDVYRLLRRPVATPQVNRDGSIGIQGLGQQYLWNAMRSLSAFDKHELSVTATAGDVTVTVTTALSYCRALEAAGYLQIVRPGRPGLTRMWRLKPSMNTGPQAPKILTGKIVYDANRQMTIGDMTVSEVAA
ncbi:hypothetical protein [Roseibium litorale]|uniref:Uncharacterized protein n=1 Tax=Roseibium litorale TaxID=2803841 RepID=A0ABR9CKR7_9HYPH|nr:hypothetical protein [Roseibium litorale]MBD8890922.1 hypothetical protein [Roseibium litorale]